jgi:transcriptional regulator with XRE-family HTH domain
MTPPANTPRRAPRPSTKATPTSALGKSSTVRSARSKPTVTKAALSSEPLSEVDVTEVVNSIGPKLRELRDRHGLSLQQLADRAEVSPAAIHKVEQGNMVPTITTLLKLAAAFDRPVSYFINEEEATPSYVHFTPANDRKKLFTSHVGIDLDGISGPYGQYFMASAVAEVAPGASSGTNPLRHQGEELIHVLTGTLEVGVGDQMFRLGAGDSVHFRTDHDHSWRNPTTRRAKAVWTALRPA